MNKTLKFPAHFVDSILASNKGVTTRLFDEKGIVAGDVLDFIEKETGRCFAEAKVTNVVEAPFEEVMADAKDVKGMYQQYSDYYQRLIEPSTPVKIISFQITEKKTR